MSQNGSSTVTEENDDLVTYLRDNMTFYSRRTFYNPIEKCLLPSAFRKFQQRIRDTEVYEDDTWMISFLRSGSTWSLEMIWLLANNLDYKAAAEVAMIDRVPFFDQDALARDEQSVDPNKSPTAKFDQIDAMPRPRIIRTHLPPELLPAQLETKKPKIMFVLRDSKDVAISYYYFSCIFFGYTGTAEKFFEAMREGLTPYGCFWHQVARLWKLRNQPNVMCLTFEEMKKDLPSVIKKTAKFLGREISDEQVAELVDHLSFSKMQTNKAVNLQSFIEDRNYGTSAPDKNFIRKGAIGDHKIVMSEETVKAFDEWNNRMKEKLGLADDEEFPI